MSCSSSGSTARSCGSGPQTGEIVGEAPAGTLTDPEDAPNDLSPDGSLLATSDARHRMRLLDRREPRVDRLRRPYRHPRGRGRMGRLRPRRQPVRRAAAQRDRALGRTHRRLPGQPPHPSARHRSVHPLPPQQLGSPPRRPGRQDLDRRHPHRHLGRASLHHRRPQPDPSGMDEVLPQPALRGDLPRVACRLVTAGSRLATGQPSDFPAGASRMRRRRLSPDAASYPGQPPSVGSRFSGTRADSLLR